MAEAPVIAPDTNSPPSGLPSTDLTPSYDLASHRNALRAMRGLEPLAEDKSVRVTEPVTATEPYQPPAYSAESHRASLAAMRGQLASGMPYTAPAPIAEDTRTSEVREFDRTQGAPDKGGYDLDLRGLETKDGSPVSPEAQIAFGADMSAALHALNFPRAAGNSLVSEVLETNCSYQSMTPAQRAEWSAGQHAQLMALPNGQALLDDAKVAFALIQEANPTIAKVIAASGMSKMTVLHLAFQAQRLEARANLQGAK